VTDIGSALLFHVAATSRPAGWSPAPGAGPRLLVGCPPRCV